MPKAKLSVRLKGLNKTLDKLITIAERGADDIDLCKIYAQTAATKATRLKSAVTKGAKR